jgi:hypothetical protein
MRTTYSNRNGRRMVQRSNFTIRVEFTRRKHSARLKEVWIWKWRGRPKLTWREVIMRI